MDIILVFLEDSFMAKSEKLFTRSLRGFAPDEVIAYIDELNAAHRNVKSESEARINTLSEELAGVKNALSENVTLREELSKKEKELSDKNSEIQRLREDNENQGKAIYAQGERICELEGLVDALKTELESCQIKSAAMEKNSKEYDAMLADVDGILSNARRQAQNLIEQADKEAYSIVKNAKIEAKQASEQIISESDQKLNENLKKVKYLYRRQDELAEIFKEHKAKVDNFFASIGRGNKN